MKNILLDHQQKLTYRSKDFLFSLAWVKQKAVHAIRYKGLITKNVVVWKKKAFFFFKAEYKSETLVSDLGIKPLVHVFTIMPIFYATLEKGTKPSTSLWTEVLYQS